MALAITGRLIGRLLGLPPVRTPKVRLNRDLAVEADDGAVLRIDRYFPVADPHAPVILIRTPYGRGSANRLIARTFAQRGYQVLIQALRGTDGSDGDFDGFVMEPSDGPATIAWLRRQEWFPGVFATWGASYLGFAQWDLASSVIPEWKAAIIDVGPSDFYRHFMYPGGAFALGNAMGWAQLVDSLFGEGRSTTPSTMSAFSGQRRLNQACAQLPISTADRYLTGRTISYFQDWITHQQRDDYWHAMDHRNNTANLPPIVHLAGGWPDFFLPNNLDDYDRVGRTARTVRLFISAAEHGRNMASRAYQRDTWSVLDHALRERGDLTNLPPVRVQLTGRKQWRDLDAWPPASTPTPWHLHPKGELGTVAAPSSAPSRFRYDPADPTPTRGGTAVGLQAGARDQRQIEARPDVLTFTGHALPDDLVMIGPVSATIFIRSSLVHTDVLVRLCDVHPNGRSMNVCDGLHRLHADNTPPDRDGIRQAQVELWPIGHVFKRGHRIRVQIASGAHPRFMRNLGTSAPIAAATELRSADQEIFHNPDHRSAVLLPIAAGQGRSLSQIRQYHGW